MMTSALYLLQDFLGISMQGGDAWESFVDGWRSFTDWRELLPMLVNVPLAILLMAPIVYRRHQKQRVYALEALEENKALLLYAAISAAIAVLVLEHPAMALVVFGMGGLLRFRTPTGSGVGTGRAITAVVIGLACGLSLYALAIILAILAFVGAQWFGSKTSLKLTVKKLASGRFEEAQSAYRDLLAEYGCQVVGTRPSPTKETFTMVVMVPEGVSPQGINESIALKIPEDLRGKHQFVLGE
jgi:hypothetical protein